jgi:poly(ADP-ribose) glycohydrolase ARH3
VLAGWPDAARTWQLAREQALITHSHPEGVDGAVLLSEVLRLALATPPTAPLSLTDSSDGPPLRSTALRTAWDALRTADAAAQGTQHRRGLLELARQLGTSVTARTSVPAAIAVALHAPDDIVGTVRAAIGLGGDTDTVAAMAAAITGAHLSVGSIPEALLRRLEARDRIASAATALARASAAKGP